MKNSRIARTIFAVIFLILFGIYTYMTDAVRLHSRDVEAWGEAVSLHKDGWGEAKQVIDEVTEPAVEPTVEPTVEPSAEPEGPVLPEVDLTSWELMLVNADNPLDESYAPPEILALSDSQCPVDSRIADALTRFAADAEAQGLSVYLSSGYRSYSEQAANFTRVCQNNNVSDGKDADGYYITMPAGCSEHQTGICCDITDQYYEIKNRSLADTELYKWMSQHCHEYGFIVRFPDGRESVTGVMFEPFHFRYVGVEAATYIMENDLCLEEFLALYR